VHVSFRSIYCSCLIITGTSIVFEGARYYVDFLVGLLLDEEEDHEAPLLVVCSVTKSEFKQKFINNYTFEVST
jgi:hypothetical protein